MIVGVVIWTGTFGPTASWGRRSRVGMPAAADIVATRFTIAIAKSRFIRVRVISAYTIFTTVIIIVSARWGKRGRRGTKREIG